MGAREKAFRAASLIPTAVCGALVFMGYASMTIPLAAFGVLDYFIFQWTDIEYEYLYLQKEISVDKIMAKTRRKNVTTIETEKIEIMAPEKSHQLDSYRNRQVKTIDLSAGHDLPDQKLYCVFYDGKKKFLLNLTDDFANAVKATAPRKVYID